MQPFKILIMETVKCLWYIKKKIVNCKIEQFLIYNY